VAAIVKHEINVGVLGKDSIDQGRVVLAADEHFDPLTLVYLAIGIDIDTNNATSLPEILLPHFQGATTHDSDLHHHRRLAPKPGEMRFIDIKIVNSLVQALVRVVEKISMKKAAVH